MRVDDLQLEVEAKFDLEPGHPLPDLADVAGVASTQDAAAQRLTATYFDTPDLRLARAGVTLRRRTGGQDAGWHLKLPVAEDRFEVRHPAGRSAANVPAELVDLVRAQTRGGHLGPVVRVRTSRAVTRLLTADGQVLAEVADDSVTAEPLTSAQSPGAGNGTRSSAAAAGNGRPGSVCWREVEVELVEGDRPLLARVGKRLRRGGACPAAAASKLARALTELALSELTMTELHGDGGLPAARMGRGPGKNLGKKPTAGAVAVAHVRAQVDELVRRDPQVRLDIADAVHRMRVATRRLRSALATFGPLFDPEPVAELRGELAWLAGLLGAARDAEVMRERLTGAVAGLAAEVVVGPVAERIAAEFDQAYRDGHAAVVGELNGNRYRGLLDALDAFVADPPLTDLAAQPATTVVHARVRHALRRVQRALTAAEAAADPQTRETLTHEVRKAAKRARYAGEAVTSVFGAPAKTFAARMKTVHEVLGAYQDSLLARQALTDLAAHATAAGETPFTYGVLYGQNACGDGDGTAALAATRTVIKRAANQWPH